MEQGTDEWFAARCGKATASKIHDIIAKDRSGKKPLAGYYNYEALLIAERLTETVADGFSSAAMNWGNEQEPNARKAYEFVKNVEVVQVGFVDHPRIDMSGASPDGLVSADGLIEIKCPNTATHIETLLGGKIKPVYVTQMQWQMACTGRQWCDFVSFDPRMPADLQLYIRRVDRDAEFITKTEREVQAFLEGVSNKVEQLRALSSEGLAA